MVPVKPLRGDEIGRFGIRRDIKMAYVDLPTADMDSCLEPALGRATYAAIACGVRSAPSTVLRLPGPVDHPQVHYAIVARVAVDVVYFPVRRAPVRQLPDDTMRIVKDAIEADHSVAVRA